MTDKSHTCYDGGEIIKNCCNFARIFKSPESFGLPLAIGLRQSTCVHFPLTILHSQLLYENYKTNCYLFWFEASLKQKQNLNCKIYNHTTPMGLNCKKGQIFKSLLYSYTCGKIVNAWL